VFLLVLKKEVFSFSFRELQKRYTSLIRSLDMEERDFPSFSHSQFLQQWADVVSCKEFNQLRKLRIQIIRNTLNILSAGGYLTATGKSVILPSFVGKGSILVTEEKVPALHTDRNPPLTSKIFAYNGDCLELHHRLAAQGLRPVVLNMASAKSPGGGYMSGAGAQEENLFRRSSYCKQLTAPYPLRNCNVVYTPDVCVFRDTEAKGYRLLEDPIPVAFIACAAKSHPQLVSGKLRLHPREVAELETKIRRTLSAALSHGHDCIVLSALGCGAFCNPPQHVAEIFHTVLTTAPYVNTFRVVAFAIFDDHNAGKAHNPEGNYRPFARVFGEEALVEGTPRPTTHPEAPHPMLGGDRPDLTPLTDPSGIVAIHITTREAWECIKDQGLSRMLRPYVHFVSGLPRDEDGEIHINLDVPKFLAEGGILFRSTHGAILSPGDTNGLILPKYFAHVTDRSSLYGKPEHSSMIPRRIHFYRQEEVPYGCFSNFSDHPVTIGGSLFPTSEHYFQAMKFEGTPYFEEVRCCGSPGESAKMGRRRDLPLRPDWEVIKNSVMFDVCLAKFTQHPQLTKVLLSTEDAKLVEHTRNDRYWGDGGDGTGGNWLGKTLMAVREEIRRRRDDGGCMPPI